jgi:hypothetical protein
MKILLLLCMTFSFSVFALGEKNKASLSLEMMEQYDPSDLTPLKARNKKFLKFSVNNYINFMNVDLGPGDEVSLKNSTLYSIKLSEPRRVYGILMDTKRKVVFNDKTNALMMFKIAEDTTIEGIKWPKGSVVKLHPQKTYAGKMIRRVKLGAPLEIDGVVHAKGMLVVVNNLDGTLRVMKKDKSKKRDIAKIRSEAKKARRAARKAKRKARREALKAKRRAKKATRDNEE